MCAYYAPQPSYGNQQMFNAQQQQAVSAASAAVNEKINRELFVGNTPAGTSELLLLHFVNAAMRRVGLCQPYESPVLNARVSNKFAFIELVNAEMANQALNLNGIPFIGNSILKFSRPSKYNGPTFRAHTWQELTGTALPTGATLDADHEKMTRELFVGNTTPEMTEHMLREFLGNALEQVGLVTAPGNPINSCRVSGKFAFIELRTAQEAKNALNLNMIPFMGTNLRIGRPSKWTGPTEEHGNWEDVLAKHLAEQLDQAPAVPGVSSDAAATGLPASRIVELQNMLSEQDLENEEEYQDILEDTREECAQFGQLKSVIIPKKGEVGATKIFLQYATVDDAAKAIAALQGRTFDGRRVQATYGDEDKFAAKNYA